MTNLQEFATIRGTAQKLKRMVRTASAGYHDDIYMRVVGSEDTVHIITQSNGRQVMSYCSFTDFKSVEGDAEAIIPTGLDNDTKGYLDYMGIAEGPGTVEMKLLGTEGDGEHPRLASYWKAEGALNTTVRLPASQEDLQKVPWDLPNRFHDGRYVSRAALDGDGQIAVDEDEIDEHVPPTHIETTTETVRNSIIEPAEFMDDVNFYPIVVRDGVFYVDLEGNTGDDRIDGEVNSEKVEGPDVDRVFDDGFSELFGELSGPVNLDTAPDEGAPTDPSPPLIVTQTDRSGEQVRHVLGPFTED